VGQDLKIEASHWDSHENEIVRIVDLIGQKFFDISGFHHELSIQVSPQSKKAFIQTAQEILAEAGNLINAVDPIIQGCADKSLVIQTQATAKSIVTLAQTLKVIVAVKASSPRDADKSLQLISVAKNLTNQVKLILRDCIGCSLRLRNGSLGDSIKFKKVLYTKK
jgi:hypothetical protein